MQPERTGSHMFSLLQCGPFLTLPQPQISTEPTRFPIACSAAAGSIWWQPRERWRVSGSRRCQRAGWRFPGR